MHFVDELGGLKKVAVSAALANARTFNVADIDVVMLDIQNDGSAPLTDLRVFVRSAPLAAMRDVTPSSWTLASALVWQPASLNPSTLSPGKYVTVGLNVSALYELELRASGLGGLLSISGAGFKVKQ